MKNCPFCNSIVMYEPEHEYLHGFLCKNVNCAASIWFIAADRQAAEKVFNLRCEKDVDATGE
jgi:hypothetical protein